MVNWQPRWYYIMRNKMTGKRYAGQTVRDLPNSNYCGSGVYWRQHCRKYGGHDRDNVEILEMVFFEQEADAKTWLLDLERRVGRYWENREEWANQVEESTKDNPWAGSSLSNRRIAEGTHPMAGERGTQINLMRVKLGTNPWAGSRGTAHSTKLRQRLLKDCNFNDGRNTDDRFIEAYKHGKLSNSDRRKLKNIRKAYVNGTMFEARIIKLKKKLPEIFDGLECSNAS